MVSQDPARHRTGGKFRSGHKSHEGTKTPSRWCTKEVETWD